MKNNEKLIEPGLRITPDLHKQLKDMAAAENRSLHNMIVNILKETVEAYKQAGLMK